MNGQVNNNQVKIIMNLHYHCALSPKRAAPTPVAGEWEYTPGFMNATTLNVTDWLVAGIRTAETLRYIYGTCGCRVVANDDHPRQAEKRLLLLPEMVCDMSEWLCVRCDWNWIEWWNYRHQYPRARPRFLFNIIMVDSLERRQPHKMEGWLNRCGRRAPI